MLLGKGGNQRMLPWLPENIASYGGKIDNLFYLIFWITTIVFFLVQTTLVVFLIKYRHRPGRKAEYTHGNSRLEILWTTVPSIICVVLALLSRSTWDEIKTHMPDGDVFVQVTAKQFNWDFTYPGPDGKFATDDDLTLENELYVPVDKVVRLTLQSRDVIHSLFIPNMRFKQDTLPGRQIQGWFKATKTGEYDIPCAELCGFGHSGMLGHLKVQSPADYAAWTAQRWPN